MTVLDIYNEYYAKLIKKLPMKDAIFLGKLYTADLFSGNQKEKMESETTSPERATYFLDNAIKPALEDDDDIEPFLKLLEVMEKFDNNLLKKLAAEIRMKLSK